MGVAGYSEMARILGMSDVAKKYAAIAKNDNKEIAIKVFREKKEDEPIIKLQQSKSKKLIRKIKHLI